MRKEIIKMFDDFDTQIQSDELASIYGLFY